MFSKTHRCLLSGVQNLTAVFVLLSLLPAFGCAPDKPVALPTKDQDQPVVVAEVEEVPAESEDSIARDKLVSTKQAAWVKTDKAELGNVTETATPMSGDGETSESLTKETEPQEATATSPNLTSKNQESVENEAVQETDSAKAVPEEADELVEVEDSTPEEKLDFIRELQLQAMKYDRAIWGDETWGHWGEHPGTYTDWTNHSNRLIPVYTWGVDLKKFEGENSIYRNEKELEKLYGYLPAETANPKAEYFDQCQIYDIQKQALKDGKKNVILMVFDGMDWPTTRAAAIYKSKAVEYQSGRGTGLAFQDYGRNEQSWPQGFGHVVTSSRDTKTEFDVDAQVVTQAGEPTGGYSAQFGGQYPWSKPQSYSYLKGKYSGCKHTYTDSAASATSMTAGIKTYNKAINIDSDGKKVKPIAHDFQEAGYAVGVITSVPISHATPAAAYAHNVSRNDYQDITRDLLGLRSSAHKTDPLQGVDLLIGCGWGEKNDDLRKDQGLNYIPGNKYVSLLEMIDADAKKKGEYVIAKRTEGKSGRSVLARGAKKALQNDHRLFGFFGAKGGHLPYRTADGKYNPTKGESKIEVYKPADIFENPTLADFCEIGIKTLSKMKVGEKGKKKASKGFWLMVEAGDVDWANHNDNIDDSIGAVLSGEEAFQKIVDWVEVNSNWDETVLILTADHGHMLVLEKPEVLAGKPVPKPTKTFPTAVERKEEARKKKEAEEKEQAAKKKAEAEAKKAKSKSKSAETKNAEPADGGKAPKQQPTTKNEPATKKEPAK